MFNMFGKKKQESFGSKNMEEYTPAYLPKNVEDGHTDLSTFIVGDYSLLNDGFIEEQYRKLEGEVSPMIQISDEYTSGGLCDPNAAVIWEYAKNKHDEEVAMHELSGKNILKARKVRIQELKERIPKLKDTIAKRQSKIEALSDKRAKYAIRIGSFMLQLGLPITALAFAADCFVNTGFVQSILYANVKMLMILVVCLGLMSDGTMYALGTLVSKKNDSTSKGLYNVFLAVFVTLFLVSVLGSVAIRVGSMPLQYGSYNAQGVFVSKDSFTIAEYALAIISSLATAVTGALSFFFSYDKEYYLEKECIKFKEEQKQDEKLCNQLETELTSLEMAVDPMICDRERRRAAEANLEALRVGLMIHCRKLLALHQQDASYADAMTVSAKKLLENQESVPGEVDEAIDINEVQKTKTTTVFREERKLKEAV